MNNIHMPEPPRFYRGDLVINAFLSSGEVYRVANIGRVVNIGNQDIIKAITLDGKEVELETYNFRKLSFAEIQLWRMANFLEGKFEVFHEV